MALLLYLIIQKIIVGGKISLALILLGICVMAAIWILFSWIGYMIGKRYRISYNEVSESGTIAKYTGWKKWSFKNILKYYAILFAGVALMDISDVFIVKNFGPKSIVATLISAIITMFVCTTVAYLYGKHRSYPNGITNQPHS